VAETVEEKALRIIRERRLTIERVDTHGGVVVARCQGDTGEYALGWDAIVKQYRCTCPEMKGLCSHLTALKMVVKRP
jgi:uncharacterized Zn finger protein